MMTYIAIGVLSFTILGLFVLLMKQQKKQEETWKKIAELDAKNSALESEKTNLEKERTQMKEDRENLIKSCELQFESVANKIFNQQKEVSRSEINNIIMPLNKKLEDFAVRQGEDKAHLAAQITRVSETNGKIKEITDNFVRALLNKPQFRGEWGENALRDLLTDMGLCEGKQFFQQVVGENDKRPDFIVLLPNKKAVIIDAKTVWDKYFEYIQSDNPSQSKELLKAHVGNIKKTIEELSTKKYHNGLKKFYSSLGTDMPDDPISLVLMFVNPEAALSTAIKEDSSIVQLAREKNIALVSITTLISTLQIIESLWTNYTLQQSNEEIKELAEELILELGRFASGYKQLGKHLQNASATYDSTITIVGENINQPGILRIAQQLADIFPTSDLSKADKKILKDTGFDGSKKNITIEEQHKA